MTLLVQSFLLSFMTFARYLIVMPFIVIPSVLVMMTAVVLPLVMPPVIVIFLMAPILSSLLFGLALGFLFASISSCNFMFGCRAAFGAMGNHNDLDFGRLVGKSFTFTLVQMVAGLFILLLLGGILAATFLMSEGGTGFLENPMANREVLATFLIGHPVVLGIGFLSMFLTLALTALLGVPMAGAAISATTKMGPTDPFLGLGSAFLPILILLIVTSVGLTLSGAYLYIGQFASKLVQTTVLYLSSKPLIWPTQDEALMGTAMFFAVIWTSCWVYAAAALGWTRFCNDREAAITRKVASERYSPEDLRAIRERREQERGALA